MIADTVQRLFQAFVYTRNEEMSVALSPDEGPLMLSQSTMRVSNVREIDSVTYEQLDCFIQILDNSMVRLMLEQDGCRVVADKYLIAYGLVLLARAGQLTPDVKLLDFYAALYLAHEMLEDLEDGRWELIPWAFPDLDVSEGHEKLQDARWKLFQKLGYRAVVSRRACEEVMDHMPQHPVWFRERPNHHSGAIRPTEIETVFVPVGPFGTVKTCDLCSRLSVGSKKWDPYNILVPSVVPSSFEVEPNSLPVTRVTTITVTDTPPRRVLTEMPPPLRRISSLIRKESSHSQHSINVQEVITQKCDPLPLLITYTSPRGSDVKIAMRNNTEVAIMDIDPVPPIISPPSPFKDKTLGSQLKGPTVTLSVVLTRCDADINNRHSESSISEASSVRKRKLFNPRMNFLDEVIDEVEVRKSKPPSAEESIMSVNTSVGGKKVYPKGRFVSLSEILDKRIVQGKNVIVNDEKVPDKRIKSSKEEHKFVNVSGAQVQRVMKDMVKISEGFLGQSAQVSKRNVTCESKGQNGCVIKESGKENKKNTAKEQVPENLLTPSGHIRNEDYEVKTPVKDQVLMKKLEQRNVTKAQTKNPVCSIKAGKTHGKTEKKAKTNQQNIGLTRKSEILAEKEPEQRTDPSNLKDNLVNVPESQMLKQLSQLEIARRDEQGIKPPKIEPVKQFGSRATRRGKENVVTQSQTVSKDMFVTPLTRSQVKAAVESKGSVQFKVLSTQRKCSKPDNHGDYGKRKTFASASKDSRRPTSRTDADFATEYGNILEGLLSNSQKGKRMKRLEPTEKAEPSVAPRRSLRKRNQEFSYFEFEEFSPAKKMFVQEWVETVTPIPPTPEKALRF